MIRLELYVGYRVYLSRNIELTIPIKNQIQMIAVLLNEYESFKSKR